MVAPDIRWQPGEFDRGCDTAACSSGWLVPRHSRGVLHPGCTAVGWLWPGDI